MKVLYVNHTGIVGGAERSFLDLLALLPPEVEPTVACPEGPLADAVGEFGVRVFPFAGIEASLRLSPWQTTLGVLSTGQAAVTIARAARRARVDLVHGISIRAGLAAVLARRLGAPRTVVDVRDCLPPGRAASLALRVVSRASAVLANSCYTAAAFESATGSHTRVVYPPVNIDAAATGSREEARHALGLDFAAPVLGVVGQLTPWKAQDDAIRTLAALKPFPEAHLLVAGSAKFVGTARLDNAAYARSLPALAASFGIEDRVHFLGERDDVPDILAALDVLLVPSWEEPFGRVVLEGMAAGLPVIATSVGGPSEVVEDGVSGILLPPREPERWAAAAAMLLGNGELRRRMGIAGRARARQFSRERHVAALLGAYEEVRGPS